MKRIVAIDGHNLALQYGTGVATYAKNLANNVGEIGWDAWTLYGAPLPDGHKSVLREVAFFDYLGGWSGRRGKVRKLLGGAAGYFRSPFGYLAMEVPRTGLVEMRRFDNRLPKSARLFNVNDLFMLARDHFKQHGRFLRVRFAEKPDVMHWTYPLPIKVDGVPNIYTLHDLVPLRLPYTTLDDKRYYHRLIKGCIEYGDHICTVSERSKEDILQFFPKANGRISNTYQSVDVAGATELKSAHDAERDVMGIYGLEPYDYFLFFGAIEPKKNVGRLVEAYLSADVSAKLVIVGSPAWKSKEEMKLLDSIERHGLSMGRNIRVFDYASRPFLMSLIRCAKSVVFPSLYEGFGLPLLEAMQLGVPTLCSGEGSLPEISGGASMIVDPYDVSKMARALERMDSDAELRAGLVALGLEQAKKFGDDSYRDRLKEMYESFF